MKIPNILKRSGGAVIKLNEKENIQITNRSNIAGKLLFRMILTVVFYTVALFVTFIVMTELFNGNVFPGFLRNFTLFSWMEEHRAAFGIMLLLIGNGMIFYHYWKKPYQFLKEIIDASEKVYEKGDQMITLSEPLKEAESWMNQLKFRIQKSERSAKEAEQRKNDLITYLAHDLKTPLTSVIGYLSLLDEVPDMPESQKEKYIHITLEKAKRLERLINEFFDITRYNLNQIVLEKEMIDLSYMLIQMSDEFYPLLKAHGNTIALKKEEDLTICADPEKLARVFQNLLKNAIAYSNPGTEIEIEAKREKKTVEIFFRNQGKTIPKQKLDTIFEKFFRLDDARATNTGGAGLGLAIAKEIVTLHKGTITAESNNGITVFTVKLPLD